MIKNNIRLKSYVVALVLTSISWIAEPPTTSGQAPSLALRKAGAVELLQLKEGDSRPFFRVTLNIVNPDGSLAELEMPSDPVRLKQAIRITAGGESAEVVYVASPTQSATRQVKRDALLVVDISGSMNKKMDGQRTRFQAAKDAAKFLLRDFQEGVDSIAIVPFESHQVRDRIKGASFASTRQEAEAQIDSLPSPNGDTALYSAALTALDLLESKKSPDRQSMLIILTDGKNDVRPGRGADPELLQDDGLNEVVRKADQVKVPIYTIGIGTPGPDFDQAVLKRMAYPEGAGNYFQAANTEALGKILKSVRQSFVDQFRITFTTRDQDFGALKTIVFKVWFELPGVPKIESGELEWVCGTIAGCAPDGYLSPEESRAALAQTPVGAPPPPSREVLRLLAILALFSGGLAFLWLLLPRWIWPHPSLPQIPKRGSNKIAPSREKASPGGEKADSPRPRRHMEETRIFDRGRGVEPRGNGENVSWGNGK